MKRDFKKAQSFFSLGKWNNKIPISYGSFLPVGGSTVSDDCTRSWSCNYGAAVVYHILLLATKNCNSRKGCSPSKLGKGKQRNISEITVVAGLVFGAVHFLQGNRTWPVSDRNTLVLVTNCSVTLTCAWGSPVSALLSNIELNVARFYQFGICKQHARSHGAASVKEICS